MSIKEKKTLQRFIVNNLYDIFMWGIVLVVLYSLFAYIFSNETFAHDDGLGFSIPIQFLLNSSLSERHFPLWTDLLGCGHPVFAECTPGYAHPLVLLFNLITDPLKARNLITLFSFIIGAVGMYGFCRELSIDKASSHFGVIGLITSLLWLDRPDNTTICLVICMVPQYFWTQEKWLKNPCLKTGLLMGVSMALVVLAGYPQTVHAILIFSSIYLFLRIFASLKKDLLMAYLKTGTIAVIVAASLSAVQILPLLELAHYSIREGGIKLIVKRLLPEFYYRGLFYCPDLLDVNKHGALDRLFPFNGSLFVSSFAFAALAFSTNLKRIGLFLGTFVLIQCGLGMTSCIYKFLYNYSLGMNAFRAFIMYPTIACIGLNTLAAMSIGLIKNTRLNKNQLITLLIIQCMTISVAIYLKVDYFPALNLVSFGLAWSIIILIKFADTTVAHRLFTQNKYASGFLSYFNHMPLFKPLKRLSPIKLLPYLLITILVFEFFFLKWNYWDYKDTFKYKTLLKTPETVKFVKQDSDDHYSFQNIPINLIAFGFIRAGSDLTKTAIRYTSGIRTPTNIIWDLSTPYSSFALRLKRSELILDWIKEDYNNTQTGFRIFDLIGATYFTDLIRKNGKYPKDFQEVLSDQYSKTKLFKNPHSHTKYQFHTKAVCAETLKEATQILKEGKTYLVLETNQNGVCSMNDNSSNSPPLSPKPMRIKRLSAEEYEYNGYLDEDGFIVIMDNNYPGWKAWVNGKETEIFYANIVGKAIKVAKGQNHIKFKFVSGSFRWGLGITLFSLFGVILIFGVLKVKEHINKSIGS